MPLDSEKKTYLVPVAHQLLGGLPAELSLDGVRFVQKPELHMTILGFAKGKILQGAFAKDPVFEEEVNRILAGVKIEPTARPGEYYKIQDEKVIQGAKRQRKSVVQLLDCPGATKVINQLRGLVTVKNSLRQAAGKGLLITPEEVEQLCAKPFPHVTLYTDDQNPMGIGIESESHFTSLQPERITLA